MGHALHAPAGPPRQMRISLVEVPLGSAAKWISLILVSVILFQTLGVALLWAFLDMSGQFASWIAAINSVTSSAALQIGGLFAFPTVMAVAAIVGVVEIVGGTSLALVGLTALRLWSRLTGGLLLGWENAPALRRRRHRRPPDS